jgi:hypothetical protein
MLSHVAALSSFAHLSVQHRHTTRRTMSSKLRTIAGIERWPPLVGNPLLEALLLKRRAADTRDDLTSQFSFAVPTEEALSAIAAVSPVGVVEIGAGTGYWARLLHDRGTLVRAYDPYPPPSPDNQWFAGRTPWFPIQPADHTVVAQHPERTMLIVWPTRNECWAADAVELFHDVGGRHVVYVGEGPGGRTGDDRFHALLGTIGSCVACAHGVIDAACICAVPQLWRLVSTIRIPSWDGYTDRLEIYVTNDAESRNPKRSRRTRQPT